MGDIKDRIRRCWPGDIAWDCPLAKFTTLRVGGPADALIQPQKKEELALLVGRLTAAGIPWRVMGRGSNIVVADRGVAGVVIVLGRALAAIWELPDATGPRLAVEAGCSLAKLLHWCREHAVGGLEFVVGIPGSVGGAIMMNAGAWGQDMGQVLSAVELMDGHGQLETRSLTPADFCYRGWQQPHGKVVVAGLFTLHHEDPAAIASRSQHLAKLRTAKQPKGVASAGSFFKNPPGDAAGRLIEQAGLKGLRVGDAEVSTVHANFLVNRGAASANDLRELMRLVQQQVLRQCGVELHPEVKFVGRWEKK